eukprot:5310239-Amphidinium_carterae.3
MSAICCVTSFVIWLIDVSVGAVAHLGVNKRSGPTLVPARKDIQGAMLAVHKRWTHRSRSCCDCPESFCRKTLACTCMSPRERNLFAMHVVNQPLGSKEDFTACHTSTPERNGPTRQLHFYTSWVVYLSSRFSVSSGQAGCDGAVATYCQLRATARNAPHMLVCIIKSYYIAASYQESSGKYNVPSFSWS